MKRISLLMFLLLPFVLSAQQVAKGLTGSNGAYIGFYEYKPTDYSNNGNEYPLIIFLHGIGERGNGTSELPRVLEQGIPNNIKRGHTMRFYWNGKWETFLVLSPQLSSTYGWWPDFYVDEMIKYAKKNLNIDKDRIFLTGLSLGGGGTWQYAGTSDDNAKKFAAIAPVCGTCQNINPCNMANAKLPVWAFHAADDGTVSVGCTLGMIANINKCKPAVKPYMTIWPNGNHAIWGRAYTTDHSYQNPNIYEWFLGQNREYGTNVRPLAKAGADITTTTGSGSATLNASGSSDPDGNLVRYAWRKISGPSFGTITDETSATTSITGLAVQGTYQYEVKVIDNRADWSFDTVTVNVVSGSQNKPPTVSAGSDKTITLPTNSTTLSGSANDPDGNIAAYLWTKASGPSSYTIASPNSSSTGISNLAQGTYVFKLKVTDNGGATAEDKVTVTVNTPPTVSAGGNKTITLPTNTTTLSGSANDPDGNIVAYLWAKASGPSSYSIANPNSSSTGISNLAQGTYVFTLRVTDNSGGTADDNVTVTVNPEANKPPVVSAGSNSVITLPTNGTTLSGSANDPDGNIVGYLWTKTSGPSSYSIANPTSASTGISNLVHGTYVFKLKVTDNSGATADDKVTVTVNKPPTVSAGSNKTITLPTNSTTLSGSADDPDGNIASYLWTKASGPSSFAIVNPSSASTGISNLVQGTYVFKLKVTDNSGATADDDVTITVNPGQNKPPVVSAGNNNTITLPTNSTTLSGSASDPDGNIVGYLWTKASGPSSYTIANPGSASTQISNLVEGSYIFNLKAADNGGAISEANVTVTVKPATVLAPVANAGPDVTISLPANSGTLDGSSSRDPNGTIQLYQWSELSGPSQCSISSVNAAVATVGNLVQGTYSFRLVVWNSQWVPSADTVNVIVNGAAIIPPPRTANAGGDVTINLPTNSATLNGSASNDPNGPIQLYLWSKLSGPSQHTIASATSATTTVSNLVQGTYSFRLVVWNNQWVPFADTMNIVVNGNAAPPAATRTANAGADITINLPTNSATLNGSASNDPNGPIQLYDWSELSGPSQCNIVNSNASVATVSNLAQGTYSFRLVVWNNQWVPFDDTVNITVNGNNNTTSAAIANAGTDVSIYQPDHTTVLNGSNSRNPNGQILGYQWTKISGPSQYTLANSNSVTTTVSNLTQGAYKFRLTIYDHQWIPVSDTVQVTVLIPINGGRRNNRESAVELVEEKLFVYPNPAKDIINVRAVNGDQGNTAINIYDINGRIVKKFNFTKNQQLLQQNINIVNLASGIYHLEIIIDNKKRSMTKFIKE